MGCSYLGNNQPGSLTCDLSYLQRVAPIKPRSHSIQNLLTTWKRPNIGVNRETAVRASHVGFSGFWGFIEVVQPKSRGRGSWRDLRYASQFSPRPIGDRDWFTGLCWLCDTLASLVRVTYDQLESVSSWLCVTFVNISTYSNELRFQVGCGCWFQAGTTSSTPLSQSWSPIGHVENCEAHRKSLHNLRPLISGCTTSIKTLKTKVRRCMTVSRLTPIFGIFHVLCGIRPGLKSSDHDMYFDHETSLHVSLLFR